MKDIDAFQSSLFEQYKKGQLIEEAIKAGNDYLKNTVDRVIYPSLESLAELSSLEESFPFKSIDEEVVLKQLIDIGADNTVYQIGGRYFGFVNGGVIPIGLASKLLASYWDQNAAMQVISPISAKLEEIVEKWLTEIFNLPEGTVAGFVSGTSMANFSALAASTI